MPAPKIILPWNGAHASIPTNWTRYTALDGRYPKAAISDLGGQAGSSTHSHTGSSHTHSYTSNSHSHTTGTIDDPSNIIKFNAQHQDAPDYDVSPDTHSHASQTTGVFTSSSISTDSFTTGNTNNEYSRYHFIFIKGSIYSPIPQSAVVMRDDTESRVNASHFDDMDGRYMKGAATGADAGSGVDVTSHSHTQSHDHTMIHNHASVNSGNASGLMGGKDVPSTTPGDHNHTVNFTQHSESPNNTDSVASATIELSHKELHFWETIIKSISQVGDIVMTDEDVPVGWEDLEYNDIYIKGKAEGESLTTGGSNTHSHANLNHVHIGTSHTHNWTTSAVGGSNPYRDGGSQNLVGSHVHSGVTSAAVNSTTGSTAASISSENHEPLHTKLKFIKLKFQIGGGALFALA